MWLSSPHHLRMSIGYTFQLQRTKTGNTITGWFWCRKHWPSLLNMNNIIMVSYAARMSSWQEMKLKTGKKKQWIKAMSIAWKPFAKAKSYMHHGFLVQKIFVKYIDYYKIILICIQVSVYVFWQIHRTDQHTEILGKHWYSLQLELFSEFYSWTYSVKVIRWIPRILLMVIFKEISCKWSPLCLQILSRLSQTSYIVQVTWHQGVFPHRDFFF